MHFTKCLAAHCISDPGYIGLTSLSLIFLSPPMRYAALHIYNPEYKEAGTVVIQILHEGTGNLRAIRRWEKLWWRDKRPCIR